jgi:hypothetical protein
MAVSKKNIQNLRNLLGALVVFLFFINTTNAQPKLTAGNYQYTIVSLNEKGFGYHITKNNKVVIKQLHIPATQGTKAFASKADAEKCAKLVVKKLAKNGGLPTISKEELLKLNIKI